MVEKGTSNLWTIRDRDSYKGKGDRNRDSLSGREVLMFIPHVSMGPKRQRTSGSSKRFLKPDPDRQPKPVKEEVYTCSCSCFVVSWALFIYCSHIMKRVF